MRKLIGTIVIVLALVYGAFWLFGTQMLAGVIEGATGAKASVQRVHLKLFPLEIGIYGTRVHNLEGFKEPELISIPEIFVRVQPLELLKGTLHVERITLSLDQVTFEKSQNGKINLKELLDRSKQKQKDAESQTPEPKSSGKSGKGESYSKPTMKIKIDEVMLNLGHLTYVDYGSGQRVAKEINIKVENQVLKNVTDTFSLTQQVIVVILKRVGVSALGVQMDILKGSFEEQAGHLMDEAKGKLSEMFK